MSIIIDWLTTQRKKKILLMVTVTRWYVHDFDKREGVIANVMSPTVSWVHRQGKIRRKNGHHIIYIPKKWMSDSQWFLWRRNWASCTKKGYQWFKDYIVFLQPGLDEFSFNPQCGKQIDHPHVYFKKSHDSLKMLCD